MSRVARFALRRPKLVVACWVLFVLVVGFTGRGVEDKVNPTQLLVPGTEPARWDELRKGTFGEDAAIVLRGPKEQLDRQGPRLARDLALRPHTRALSPWSAGGGAERLRPGDETAVLVLDLEIPPGQTRSTVVPPLKRFVEQRVRDPIEPHFAGEAPLGRDINEATTEGAHKAELLAAPILIVVLLLVFRSPIAAAIPLIMGQGTVFASFGVISILLEWTKLDAVALSLASGIGLALGVDYSLLIITRFREGLEKGYAVRQAASIAANTAGRTALSAGFLLVAIMLVSFFLSPGSVLLSSAVGSIVAALLSMVSAALVTPAAVVLLGHNINRWPLGRERKGGRGLTGLVTRVTRRPVFAASVVLAALILLASPVAAMEMIPPDPRQLPEDSRGLEDYDQIRRAGFGPTVEVVLRSPRGTVMDPRTLREIEPFQRRLSEIRYVRSVFGPETLADQTRALRRAPRSVRRARRQLRKGERDLTRLRDGLRAATGGVGQLRRGLLEAAFGARRLKSGAELAQEGSGDLAAGNRRAYRGSGELVSGTRQAREGASRLADGNRQLSNGLNGELAPGADRLATELRAGQGRLSQLRLAARGTENRVQAAWDTLNRMTVGKTDPLFAQALAEVGAAVGAATGRNPLTGQVVLQPYQGLDAALGQAVAQTGQAADGATRLSAGAREAAGGAQRLANGADELEGGLVRLENGNLRLQRGLAQLARGSEELRDGLGRLGSATSSSRAAWRAATSAAPHSSRAWPTARSRWRWSATSS